MTTLSTGPDKQNDAVFKANLPSRGKVLCIFADPQLVISLEPAVTAEGYTLLRARHGMHGYWMALTALPDLIVTDIPQPEQESNYLLDCLSRNVKTRSIPVIALVNASQQRDAIASCLRHASLCLTKSIAAGDFIKQAADLIAKNSATAAHAESGHAVSHVDAFFSELGHDGLRVPNISKSRRRPRLAPMPRPHAQVTLPEQLRS